MYKVLCNIFSSLLSLSLSLCRALYFREKFQTLSFFADISSGFVHKGAGKVRSLKDRETRAGPGTMLSAPRTPEKGKGGGEGDKKKGGKAKAKGGDGKKKAKGKGKGKKKK